MEVFHPADTEANANQEQSETDAPPARAIDETRVSRQDGPQKNRRAEDEDVRAHRDKRSDSANAGNQCAERVRRGRHCACRRATRPWLSASWRPWRPPSVRVRLRQRPPWAPWLRMQDRASLA